MPEGPTGPTGLEGPTGPTGPAGPTAFGAGFGAFGPPLPDLPDRTQVVFTGIETSFESRFALDATIGLTTSGPGSNPAIVNCIARITSGPAGVGDELTPPPIGLGFESAVHSDFAPRATLGITGAGPTSYPAGTYLVGVFCGVVPNPIDAPASTLASAANLTAIDAP